MFISGPFLPNLELKKESEGEVTEEPTIELTESVPRTKKSGQGHYVVKRREGQGVKIGGCIEIFIKEIKDSNVLMTLKCPPSIKIERVSQ